jgi:uncharacterized protein (DUF2249 family)
MNTSHTITLDVRPDFRAGQHPCDKIQNALGSVGENETLRLLVPFEPLPLYEVAAGKGLGHTARTTPEGDWEVLFSRNCLPTPKTATVAAPQSGCGCGCSESTPAEIVDVDARGLEPPQPMMRILEAVEILPANSSIRAHTDRRPLHLYPLLEVRGFSGISEEQADGSFITHIRRD